MERYLKRRRYEIRPSGGDKIIIAPRATEQPNQQLRPTLRIGHTSCSQPGSELLKVYVSKLRHVFGISVQDILDE